MVLHLAAVNGTQFFYTVPDRVLEVGVKGMMNVIDACLAENIRELITASSSEVYQVPDRIPTDEAERLVVPDPLNPRFSYGGSKIISELLTLNYGRKHFDRVLVFRPHNVYGPNMGWEHVIPQLSVRLARLASSPGSEVTLPIQGTGQETRAFIHIRDFVDGLMHLIDHGRHMEIYNIGNDAETTVAELAMAIGRCLHREVNVQPAALQPGSTARRCPDIGKLRALGYSPKVTLESGLRETVDWYVENHSRAPPSLA
jgi:nucleoside-diphosphate-sugar epimerase